MKHQTIQAVILISSLIATAAFTTGRGFNLPALYWLTALGYTIATTCAVLAIYQRKHHPPTT